MAEFAVKTHTITVRPHPDPEVERLECAMVGDYSVVVGKGNHQTGDVVAYIPEASVVPQDLIVEMGLEGRLTGSQRNRVKAVKLRGQLSQGLVYKVSGVDEVGVDVTDVLGITKYEPRIPAEMAGEVWNAFGQTLKYDIENIKGYPNVLEDGETVVFTEKIHGTWTCLGLNDGTPIVTSKGQSARGLAFKIEDGLNDRSMYVQQWREYGNRVRELAERLEISSVYVLGELYGPGVQDLQYGLKARHFRVFDVFVGPKDTGRYLSYDQMMAAVDYIFETVPILYYGPFKKNLMEFYANGRDNGGMSILANHVREGIVIRPLEERTDPDAGRCIFKSVSEKYLLRKSKNATDYQ